MRFSIALAAMTLAGISAQAEQSWAESYVVERSDLEPAEVDVNEADVDQRVAASPDVGEVRFEPEPRVANPISLTMLSLFDDVVPSLGRSPADGNALRLAAYAEPLRDQPLPETGGLATGDYWDVVYRLEQQRQSMASSSTQIASGAETQIAGNEGDTAGFLQASNTVQSVQVQRRSPVALEPNMRGFKAGQIYTQINGVYWMPARRDLDTMLNKIDPHLIRDAIVTAGPHGLRYGPGLGFIAIERESTPRHEGGFQTQFDTQASVRTNGSQLYGRETFSGGGKDWGFRLSYGHRTGNDYRAGSGLRIPSSYNRRDALGEFSYDVNPHQRIDFAYQRIDLTDTDFAGQFFDVNSLWTNAFELRIVDDDPCAPWTQLSVEAWYNRTRFDGDTSNKANPDFPVIERVNFALDQEFAEPAGTFGLEGATEGATSSAGGRVGVVLGDLDGSHLRVGTDFRNLDQNIREDYTLTPDPDPQQPTPLSWYTNMPDSWMTDTGLYAEWLTPLSEAWRVSLGGRADLIGSRARAADLRDGSSLPSDEEALSQDETLYAFSLTNRLKLNKHWTLLADFGHSQRPATLIERYADGLFLSLVQSGFSRMIGDPTLNPERNFQLDVAVRADYERWRGKAGFFHAWVHDYITYEDDTVVQFAAARLLRFANTSLATLSGFELSGEFDLMPRLAAFGQMAYVEGQDEDLGAPLPSIPPLNSRVGLRLHDRCRARRWQVECSARIVLEQDRLGAIRLQGAPTVLEERTPGFTVWDLAAYYHCTDNFSLVAGIDNVFDKNYQEHLDLRLDGPAGFAAPPTRVLSPGFTPYFALKWVF